MKHQPTDTCTATNPPRGLPGKGITRGRVTFPDDRRPDSFRRKGKSVTAILSAEGKSTRSRGRAFHGKDSGDKSAALPGPRREEGERDGSAAPLGRGRLQEPTRAGHYADGRTGVQDGKQKG